MLTLNSTVSELLLEPLSYYAKAEIQALLAPAPIIQPAVGDDAAIIAIATAHGFSKCLVKHWEWATEDHILVDTAWLGGITPNGILVVPFTPNLPVGHDVCAMASAVGYPAPNMGNMLTLCISETPCALYAAEPGTAVDNAPTVVFGVGTVSSAPWWNPKPTAVALQPGVTYYINVAGRKDVSEASPWGTATALPGLLNYPACDFRLEAQKPRGH